MSQGRKPDYNLAALDKETGFKNNRIGAAWINPDGRISIQLNPFVVLDGTNPNLVVTLFPYQEYGGRESTTAVEEAPKRKRGKRDEVGVADLFEAPNDGAAHGEEIPF